MEWHDVHWTPRAGHGKHREGTTAVTAIGGSGYNVQAKEDTGASTRGNIAISGNSRKFPEIPGNFLSAGGGVNTFFSNSDVL